MTDFVLVRHGETVWHAENRYAGRSDVPLTPRGREQAERLGDWAATAGLAAAVSSPMVRARDTLAPAARAAGLTPGEDARLTEVDFGDGEGRTRTEMAARFPDALEAFLRDPVTHHLPGGEHPKDAVARAVACLDELASAHPDGRVLVVWHSAVMRLALCHLLGIPTAEYRRVFPVVRNAARTEIRRTGDHCALLALNVP